jgi:hypothetical protein
MKANEKSRQDKNGKRWNFHYWYSGASQRLFFWDDEQLECGVVLFLPGKTIRYARIQDLIVKLVSDRTLRQKYQRELVLPLDDRYLQYPLFDEELNHEAAKG